MITFQKAYAVGDKTYATLREAQVSAIQEIIAAGPENPAEAIVARAAEVVCALTTTERSKPRARALNGGRKPRKPKTDTAPQFKLAATAPK